MRDILIKTGLACLIMAPSAAAAQSIRPHLNVEPLTAELGGWTANVVLVNQIGVSGEYQDQGGNDDTGVIIYNELAGEASLKRKFQNGWTAGIAGNGLYSASVDTKNDFAFDGDDIAREKQQAVAFAYGGWGQLQVGHLRDERLAVSAKTVQTGRSQYDFHAGNTKLYGWGARYILKAAPHLLTIAANKDADAQVSYLRQTPVGAYNYWLGWDAVYQNEASVQMPALAANTLNGDDAAYSFNLGGQVDYGRLYTALNAGYERLESGEGDNHLFGSAGLSTKINAWELSAGLAGGHYLDSEVTNAEVELGLRYYFSRGMSFVFGGGIEGLWYDNATSGDAETDTHAHADFGLEITF